MISVDVEVVLKRYSEPTNNPVTGIVQKYLEKMEIRPNSVITNIWGALHNEVTAIIIGDIPNYNKQYIDLSEVKIKWYMYSLDIYGPVTHTEEDDDGITVMSTQLSLPSPHLLTLWENLYYDTDIKQNLLRYAQTMMEFGDKGVDGNVISCNKVILLHGPPGTGKTSLCKALAQKLTVHMQGRFTSGLLIEINSHSLFSKWFSESGKLVNKMFSKIREVVENTNLLVCVLIDEIESLARARDQCISGTEPSDSIRVVNTLLTQIDEIRSYKNVLIFATSNMTETIDLAFVDRADIKQFIGLPSVPAIYNIYLSCLEELMKAQIIKEQPLERTHAIKEGNISLSEETKHLMSICEQSRGLSGRSLRKVPFIAHALFLDQSFSTLKNFLVAMENAVHKEITERQYFSLGKKEV
ncbi:unnamed protein product [Callosobruchus maculatus]|uniref:AAA+ ATPase domain-containing protein n=1 Tax=Callosobruchus maculatus TaxID=64391 RepID=A0A653D428_CALMS|nr:unnamed protein product [Callosobruchus maculatus]